jgi:hypothetical protein
VVVAWDRTASEWDGTSFALQRVLRDFESEGASIAFSHDGRCGRRESEVSASR